MTMPTDQEIDKGERFFMAHKDEAADLFGEYETQTSIAHVLTILRMAGLLEGELTEQENIICQMAYSFGRLAQRDGWHDKDGEQ